MRTHPQLRYQTNHHRIPSNMKLVTEEQQRVGQLRLQSDKRQLGGLMMLLGSAALVYPEADLATLIGPNGSTGEDTGIQLTSLVAAVVIVFYGIVSIVTGYLQAVHDVGNVNLTGFLLLWGQLAWMPFLTSSMSEVGKGGRSGHAFIPKVYQPTHEDVRFVGAMGIMGILGYGLGFLGSLSLIQFALHAFQKGKPNHRTGKYYRSRLVFYSCFNFVVGLAQMLLGAYIMGNFGHGALPKGPIVVAMFVVSFPEIAVTAGVVHMANAIYGMARGFGFHGGANDHWFQATTLVSWICTVVLQILVQVCYVPGGNAAPAAPTYTMMTMGMSVMVAFLDFKMRTVPDEFPPDYYGMELENDGAPAPPSEEVDEAA